MGFHWDFCPGPCLVDLPGHALEVHLSQIAKWQQITHPSDIKKGTGWRGHTGHSLMVPIVNVCLTSSWTCGLTGM